MTNVDVGRRLLFVIAAAVAFFGLWLLLMPYYGAPGSEQSNLMIDVLQNGGRERCGPAIEPVSESADSPSEACREVGIYRIHYGSMLLWAAVVLSAGARLAFKPQPRSKPEPLIDYLGPLRG